MCVNKNIWIFHKNTAMRNIKPLVYGTADMTSSRHHNLFDSENTHGPLTHSWPPLYFSVLWYKSCRLCLLSVIFAFVRMPQLILYHVLASSISWLNVTYLFPFFPHSVSFWFSLISGLPCSQRLYFISDFWREQTSMRLVQLYQCLPSQTTSRR